jgi:hypothetical protein
MENTFVVADEEGRDGPVGGEMWVSLVGGRFASAGETVPAGSDTMYRSALRRDDA